MLKGPGNVSAAGFMVALATSVLLTSACLLGDRTDTEAVRIGPAVADDGCGQEERNDLPQLCVGIQGLERVDFTEEFQQTLVITNPYESVAADVTAQLILPVELELLEAEPEPVDDVTLSWFWPQLNPEETVKVRLTLRGINPGLTSSQVIVTSRWATVTNVNAHLSLLSPEPAQSRRPQVLHRGRQRRQPHQGGRPFGLPVADCEHECRPQGQGNYSGSQVAPTGGCGHGLCALQLPESREHLDLLRL